MSIQSNSPVERVQSSYRKLSEVASALNEVSDSLGQQIAELDSTLKKLNLGVTVWVPFRGNVEDNVLWSEDLGYAKVRGKWGVALRTFVQPCDDEPQVEEWLFNDAPRQLRLSAVEKLPELLEKLSQQGEQTTQEVCCKVAEVGELVDAVKKAAGTSSNEGEPRLRPRPLNGGKKP